MIRIAQMATRLSRWRQHGSDRSHDSGLMLLSVGLVALAQLLLADRVSMTMFAVTATATAATMHARLAMGRWRSAVQLLCCLLVLVALHAAPRVIAVVGVAGLAASAFAERSTHRQAVPRVGAMVGAAAGLAALVAIAAGPLLSWTVVTGDVIAAVGAGTLAPPIMLAFAPLAEWLLGHVTPLTLAAWLNYDHPLLREDFLNSFLAAFTLDEIRDQLRATDLQLIVKQVTDRHVDVFGCV